MRGGNWWKWALFIGVLLGWVAANGWDYYYSPKACKAKGGVWYQKSGTAVCFPHGVPND